MTQASEQKRQTPIKMHPGDDLHLTMLMASHGLNFVTGKDREQLLAWGRDVWQAAHHAPVVPQGWNLVPVEPTEKMVNEGSCAQTTQHGHGYIGEYAAKTAWQHMLAAAPQPPEAHIPNNTRNNT